MVDFPQSTPLTPGVGSKHFFLSYVAYQIKGNGA